MMSLKRFEDSEPEAVDQWHVPELSISDGCGSQPLLSPTWEHERSFHLVTFAILAHGIDHHPTARKHIKKKRLDVLLGLSSTDVAVQPPRGFLVRAWWIRRGMEEMLV